MTCHLFSVNAVRVLGPSCDHTAGLWIRGHALSASQPAIYNPFPLRLMTWSEQVEIMQITFPWKSLSLDRVRGVSLRVRVSVFVFTLWGRVHGSDGTAVEVQDETAFSSFDTFSPTGCID